jgi:hypothetical protein
MDRALPGGVWDFDLATEGWGKDTREVPCRNNKGGVTKLSVAQAQALEKGSIYVNIHTKRNPGGEVRGQLRAARLWLRTQG